MRTMASHQDDSPAIPAEGRGRLTFKTRTVPAFGTRSANENRLEDPPEDVRGQPRLSREDAMDPDFFEVVMGADGTLKCFPADAMRTIPCLSSLWSLNTDSPR